MRAVQTAVCDRNFLGRVNIKARTHEKVDSIGEGRALSCHAVVLLEKKPPVKEEEKKEETYQ